jgi:hypothetical protein
LSVNESDFILFNETLQKYDFNTSFWYAVVGNHDRYNTGLNYSLFETYLRNETQYAVDFNPGFGMYRFVMMDTTQQGGAKSFFNYFGDMQANKLDNLEALLTYPNPAGINQSILFGHQPLNQIMSETTQDGKNLQDLVAQSDAQFVMDGHLHYPNLYADQGSYTEVECPSFASTLGGVTYHAGNMYRICAFDNDIASFSDVVLGQWPQIVVTNPTDARFYNTNMPLSRMAQDNEIDTLIFDPSPIISAYAVIDGQVVGNLKNQGDNLWTVPWNTQLYQTGVHQLTVYVSSADGNANQSLNFELSGFTPTPIASSIEEVFFSAPLLPVFVTLAVVLAAIGIAIILVPYCVQAVRRRRTPQVTPSDEDNVAAGEQKRTRFRALQPALSIPLLALFAYPFVGPLIVGPFVGDQLGAAFLVRVYIGSGYFLDLGTFLVAAMFLVCGLLITGYVLNRYGSRHNWVGIFCLLLNYVILISAAVLVSVDFGAVTCALTPEIYLIGLLPVYFAVRLKKAVK